MRARVILPTVVLAVTLSATGSAGATTAQIGGPNAQPTEGCAGAGGTTFVQVKSQPGLPYAAPFSGVITSWSFVSGPTVGSPVKLKVFRPTPLPSEFMTVGESAEVTPVPNTHTTFAASIPVAAGDLLGLRSTTGASTPCIVTTWSFDDLMRASTAADTAPGTPASMALGFDRRRIPIGAAVETDVDADGLGDDSQDGDDDGDGVADGADNCPTAANPGQANSDRDAQGDACDDDPTIVLAGVKAQDDARKVPEGRPGKGDPERACRTRVRAARHRAGRDLGADVQPDTRPPHAPARGGQAQRSAEAQPAARGEPEALRGATAGDRHRRRGQPDRGHEKAAGALAGA